MGTQEDAYGYCHGEMHSLCMRCLLLPWCREGLIWAASLRLSEKGDHPVQLAWDEADVPQCGYCQAGQMMTAAAFLKRNPTPTVDEIMNAMHGNICRCGAYHRIREAVQLASTKMKKK